MKDNARDRTKEEEINDEIRALVIARSFINGFECHYCGGTFCGNHRLPEKHKCTGDPLRPSGGLAEKHSGGHVSARGK